jgi:hypothetical protein
VPPKTAPHEEIEMAEQQQRATLPKMISIKDEGYYSNCTMLETSPFDISILFGRLRPSQDESGNRSLVEVYEKQIYLSHLQARALYETLGKSLTALNAAKSGQKEPAQ